MNVLFLFTFLFLIFNFHIYSSSQITFEFTINFKGDITSTLIKNMENNYAKLKRLNIIKLINILSCIPEDTHNVQFNQILIKNNKTIYIFNEEYQPLLISLLDKDVISIAQIKITEYRDIKDPEYIFNIISVNSKHKLVETLTYTQDYLHIEVIMYLIFPD